MAIPYFIWEFCNSIWILIPTIIQMKQPIYTGDSDSGRLLNVKECALLFLSNYYGFSIRLIQVLLVFFKVAGIISCSWALLFLPIWILGFLELLKSFAGLFSRSTHAPPGLELFQFLFFLYWASLFFSFAILITKRLDSGENNPYVSTIMIPVFIFFSMLFLCSSCCFPCMLRAQKDAIDEELANAHESEGEVGTNLPRLVAMERRIAPA